MTGELNFQIRQQRTGKCRGTTGLPDSFHCHCNLRRGYNQRNREG